MRMGMEPSPWPQAPGSGSRTCGSPRSLRAPHQHRGLKGTPDGCATPGLHSRDWLDQLPPEVPANLNRSVMLQSVTQSAPQILRTLRAPQIGCNSPNPPPCLPHPAPRSPLQPRTEHSVLPELHPTSQPDPGPAPSPAWPSQRSDPPRPYKGNCSKGSE